MTVTRTVVPGEWYGVLGDAVIVLLPPAAKGRVAAIWESVDDGAGFDEVLDTLISGGLRELPSFVLVAGDGDGMRVVIRGAGVADLVTADGPRTVTGDADTTWVEATVAGVTRLELRVADAEGDGYSVGPGLVRVASVAHPATTGATAEVDDPTASTPAGVPLPMEDAEAIAVPVVVPQPPVADEPTEEPIEEPTEESTQEQVAEPPIEPPIPAPIAAPIPAPTAAPSSAPGLGSSYDPLTSPDLAVSVAVARLVFPSGEVVDVDRTVIVGRSPDQGRFGPDARLVTVLSPHHEISSTHLEVRPGTGGDRGVAVATDLGSTNGTVVVQPGHSPEDLAPGVAVRLQPGALIDLGEGVSIQVSAT